MVNSMTGFASVAGEAGGYGWTWELRSVNARGLDLRLRLPDAVQTLEPQLRKLTGQALSRGNVTAGLRLEKATGSSDFGIDAEKFDQTMVLIRHLGERAATHGLTLAAPSATDLLTLRQLQESGDAEMSDILPAILEGFSEALEALVAMRGSEGAALRGVLDKSLDETARLVGAAEAVLPDRGAHARAQLGEALERLTGTADGVDPDRMAQELALIAVKADVTEEIDRLKAHLVAARDLLASSAPMGRKLDFLMQEFNREANTLCSKSQNVALTRVGLDLKTVIDQMREQVQNLE
ncbi:MAG: YicC/YloC family endoribonuclease [Pseudomonadota bacterium]